MTQYSDHQIEDAIRTVASLIERFGDAYWPILERLEGELEHRRARQAKLRYYLKIGIAKNDQPPYEPQNILSGKG